MKSESAAVAVSKMNPDLAGKIDVHQERVGPDTESKDWVTMLRWVLNNVFFVLDVYNDDFFEKLSGVTNALDNVEARKHTKWLLFAKMDEWSTNNHRWFDNLGR